MIRELQAPRSSVRCQHEIIDEGSREFRAHRGKDQTCDRLARYEINGKNYCGQHAGVVAIQRLLEIDRSRSDHYPYDND